MKINYQIAREAEVVGPADTSVGGIAVKLPSRFGSRVLNLGGDELVAEIAAYEDLLLFSLADFGGEDTLYIYLIDSRGLVEESVELFGPYTHCELKLLQVGEQIIFSFFNDAIRYSLHIVDAPRLQILPNLTGVQRSNRFAVKSRLVLRSN